MMFDPLLQPDHFQRSQGFFAAGAGAHTSVTERQEHIFERAGTGEQVELLENEADLAAAHLGISASWVSFIFSTGLSSNT